MKKSERQRLEAFIAGALPILEMRDWRVGVSAGKPPAGCIGSSLRVDGQKFGWIRVSKDFWALPDAERRQTVLHELLHLLSADVRDFVFKAVPGVTQTPAWSAFHPLFEHAIEVMVDSLAYCLAGLIDLEV